MDTTDPSITFDQRGWCDYCRNFHSNIEPRWHPDERGRTELMAMAERIRSEGRSRDYDCIIGISGGVDSSYVTHVATVEMGLRPLIFHVDAGWNSQQAVNNIEKMISALDLDLFTEVIDWREMKDIQLAFLRAQVPHQDTPQDHAFFGALYRFAAQRGFKYVLTGSNYSTESVREPWAWHYTAMDVRQIKDIHGQFGERPLRSFPLTSPFRYKLYYGIVKGMQVAKPLNLVPYVRADAIETLGRDYGWQAYGQKHYESRFTRFYEGYYLPTKFGFDKRRAYLSSLILSGQISREDALTEISQPAYDRETIEKDIRYVAKKLSLSVEDLQELLKGENRTYEDYKNMAWLFRLGIFGLGVLGRADVIQR
jgi:N-acetyl sugar amidotransferase